MAKTKKEKKIEQTLNKIKKAGKKFNANQEMSSELNSSSSCGSCSRE
ncbi:MAG: hypothetical protein PWP31_1792 [Clostridia bacterium]|nr:hypothetical protein [Clostridia bacterium]